MLCDEMRTTHSEFYLIRDGSDIDKRLEEKIKLLPELFAGLDDTKTDSPQQADDLIFDMERR